MRLAVCSWSLRPRTPRELVERVRACGLARVQLALDPLRGPWDEAATVAALRDGGVEVVSGMLGMRGEDYTSLETIRRTGGLRPDAHWPANLEAARATAALARRLGLGLVSFHAGFLPEEPGDPERATLLARLGAVVDAFAAEGISVALETGQETAATLEAVLDELDRPTLGVNFDPANLLLYGTDDPVPALRRLAPRVLQVHAKDARRTRVPGTWGEETPLGEGEVDLAGLVAALREAGRDVDLVIEREGGDDRVGDVRRGRRLLEELVG